MGRHRIQTSFFAGIRYKSWQNLKQRIETNIQSISTNAGAVLRDKCAETQLTHQSEKGPERFAGGKGSNRIDSIEGRGAHFDRCGNSSTAPNIACLFLAFQQARAMNRKIVQSISALFFGLLPIPSLAQCSDPLCKNLQTILDEAVTDFRGYRLNKEVGPNVSIEGTKVPCQPSTWANNVPMYICYAQVPSPDSQKWFTRTLQALQSLNPAWHFQINSPGEDHYVDAGPLDCEITPTEGPYIGQCPLHLQVEKQGDGTAKVYLWMNSLSSPYLLKHASGACFEDCSTKRCGLR